MTKTEWLRVQGTEWVGIGANESELCKGFRDCADEIERLTAENERLRAAIRWALGEASDDRGAHFGEDVPPLEARYWWRKTLRRMAGLGDLRYDKEHRTIVHQQNALRCSRCGENHSPRCE